MKTATRPYRSPTVTVRAEASLDEFSTEDLRAELDHREGKPPVGAIADDDDGFHVDGATASRLRTLVLCGQRKYVADELLAMLEQERGLT